MRRLAIGIFLLSALGFYFTEIDKGSTINKEIIEVSQKLPMPIWLMLFSSGLVFFGISIFKPPKKEVKKPLKRRPISRPTTSFKAEFKLKENSPLDSATDNETETELDSIIQNNDFISEEPTLSLDLREASKDLTRETAVALMKKRMQAIDWPRGSSIKIDTGKDTPFTLRLEAITPGGAKRAIAAFGTLLAEIPTPRRASIQLVKIIDSGIPMHRVTQGILRPALKGKPFTITSQLDSVDIRFGNPDEFWAVLGNLENQF